MGIKHLVLLTSIVFSFPIVSMGQEDLRVEKIDGKKFILHTVEQGQTIYGLSKLYKVEVSAILSANSSLEVDGIRIGQVVKIPHIKQVERELEKREVRATAKGLQHIVSSKETAYGIASSYEISLTELYKENPFIEEKGLQIGDTVRIVLKQPDLIVESAITPATHDSLKLHEVMPKETLYGLAKLYDVSADSIRIVNDGLPQGLQIGQSIRIPKKNAAFKAKAPAIKKSFITSKTSAQGVQIDTLDMALLLPLFLSVNDSLDTLQLNDEKPYPIYKQSHFSLDFLQGAMFAADSLGIKGYPIKLSVIDTKDDAFFLPRELEDSKLRNKNLVLGPFYKSVFEQLADSLVQHNVHMVTPVRVSSRLLLNRMNVTKMEGSNPAHTIGLCNYVNGLNDSSSVILVNSGRVKDSYAQDLAVKYLNLDREDSVRVFNAYSIDQSKWASLMRDSGSYTLVLPSEDQPYVTKALVSLVEFLEAHESVSVKLFGLEKWLSFDNLETEHLVITNTHIVAQHYIDYQDSNTQEFIRKYREQFLGEPTAMSFKGYDLVMYFAKGLFENGSLFFSELQQHKAQGLMTPFHFVRVGLESGYENSGVCILNYENFELKRVNRP